jgi:hypothetical protein
MILKACFALKPNVYEWRNGSFSSVLLSGLALMDGWGMTSLQLNLLRNSQKLCSFILSSKEKRSHIHLVSEAIVFNICATARNGPGLDGR